MKLLIYHPWFEEFRREVTALCSGVEVVAGHDQATLDRGLPEAEAVLAFRVPVEALGRAPRLRWIQLTSAGVDHLAAAREALARVVVTNASGIHGMLMADYVFGTLVMLQWRFLHLVRQQQARAWESRFTEPLAGKTMGVVGLGAIGAEIARRAPAFGLRVVGLRRRPGPAVEGVDRVLGPGQLPELLRGSDVLVLTLPETDETRGLIGDAELAMLPRGAFVINVGRGSALPEEPLVRALRSGHVAGAALDVFAQEPLPAASPLWDLDNVIVTPHISGETTGYVERVVRQVFADNVARFQAGQPLRNVVDLARGY